MSGFVFLTAKIISKVLKTRDKALNRRWKPHFKRKHDEWLGGRKGLNEVQRYMRHYVGGIMNAD